MTKLTDSQLILLSRASQHADGVLEDAGSMRAGAASKVAGALIRRKLMKETRAKPGMPVWRRDENGRNLSLVITKAGLKAIGAEEVAKTSVPVDPGPAGTAALLAKAAKSGRASDRKAAVQGHQEKAAQAEKVVFRPGSKQAKIVDLLRRAEGASITDLMQATGWLPHSTRAALTGLRKRGLGIERSNDPARGTVYNVEKSREAIAGA